MPEPSADTVHIVDDAVEVLRSTALLLQTAGYKVATYGSGQALLDALPGAAPGCVLTDVRMPGLSGLELQERLAAARPDLPVIVVTGHGDIAMAVRAMRAGAVHFIEKPLAKDVLIAAVEDALRHARRMADQADEAAEAGRRAQLLTAREREVMTLLVDGNSNKEIANRLGISPRTVEGHRAMVLGKMQTRHLADLVRMALAVERAGKSG